MPPNDGLADKQQKLTTAPASEPSRVATLFAPGQAVAEKYEIIDLLGTGGMSAVYRARHLLTKQIVALKVLIGAGATSIEHIKRFQHEARAVSKLNHPNIVRMYDFGSVDGLPYLTMDLIDGKTLATLIKEHDGLSPEQTIRLFQGLCSGLAHAHANGVLHRDIKPSNIMVPNADPDTPKIVDFGIAKVDSEETQGLTKTGEVFGSPFYMSPEQCQGHKPDVRSDAYSLGCVLFECLTGQPPFVTNNVYATIRMHMEEAPPRLVSIKPMLGGNTCEQFQQIIFKAMSKDPADRYQSMQQLMDAVNSIQKNTGLSGVFSRFVGGPRFKTRKDKSILKTAGIITLLTTVSLLLIVSTSYTVGSIQEWITIADETIHRPSGSIMEQWQTTMRRGMNHMNYGNLALAQQNLLQAASLAKALPDYRQQILSLKQLRILYHIRHDPAQEKETRQQLSDLKVKSEASADESYAALEQMIGLLPARPNADEVEQIHLVIQHVLAFAGSQAEKGGEDHKKLLDALQTALAKTKLPPNDDHFLELKIRNCWMNEDYATATELLQTPNLSEKQKMMLDFVRAAHLSRQHQQSAAIPIFTSIAKFQQAQGPSLELARAQGWLGYAYTQAEDYDAAAASYLAEAQTYKKLGNDSKAAGALSNMAAGLVHVCKADKAQRLLEEIIGGLNLNSPRDQILAARCYELLMLSTYQLGRGDPENGRRAIEHAQLSMDPDHQDYRTLVDYCCGSLWTERLYRLALGLSLQLKAIDESANPPDLTAAAKASDLAMCCYEELGKHSQAEQLFSTRMANFAAEPGEDLPLWNSWFAFAAGRFATKEQFDLISDRITAAINSAATSGAGKDTIIEAMHWLARLYAAKGDTAREFQTYKQGADIIHRSHVSSNVSSYFFKEYAAELRTAGDTKAALEIDQEEAEALSGKSHKAQP